MRNLVLPVIFLFCLGIFLVTPGCVYDKMELPAPKDTTTVPTPPVDTCNTNVKYSVHIKRIVTNSCAITGCHVPGGSGNGDYTTGYSGIFAKVSNAQLKKRIYEIKDMPPPSSGVTISDCDREKIKSWYDAGGPNN